MLADYIFFNIMSWIQGVNVTVMQQHGKGKPGNHAPGEILVSLIYDR